MFCQIIVLMNFHALEIFGGFRPKDKRVIEILATLNKGLLTRKVLQLEFSLKICCSATLSLAIR